MRAPRFPALGATVLVGVLLGVACAAAWELRAGGRDSKESVHEATGGGELRLALYDSCSVVRRDDAAHMEDAIHMSPRMLNRTVRNMLARFVCPNHARTAAGIDASKNTRDSIGINIEWQQGAQELPPLALLRHACPLQTSQLRT